MNRRREDIEPGSPAPWPHPRRRMGEADWQPQPAPGRSRELENHSRPDDPPEIRRVPPEPPESACDTP